MGSVVLVVYCTALQHVLEEDFIELNWTFVLALLQFVNRWVWCGVRSDVGIVF